MATQPSTATISERLNIWLHLASEPQPVSLEELADECGVPLPAVQDVVTDKHTAHLLRYGPDGLVGLSVSPSQIDLAHLFGAASTEHLAAGADSDAIVASLIAAGGTLSRLAGALQAAEQDICPYFEACALVGEPEDLCIRRACTDCQ